MRKLIVIVIFYSISLAAKSQNFLVEGTAPDLYVRHTVAPKENFYSISRLFNQSPKLIASFNKIEMEKGLTIGQHIKIPLTAQNFDISAESKANSSFVPVTHIVAKSETLFKIGSNANVTPEAIRKWNNLSSDQITPGTTLIIGYLKTTGNVQSVVAAAGKEKEVSASAIKKQDANAETVISSNKNNSVAAPATVGKDTALAVAADNPVAPVKEEVAKQPEIATPKTVESKKANQTMDGGSALGNFEEIYLQQTSQKSENTKSGEAATFKSTSGWQDKKYYVLINDITPGTIIKISSSTDKAVYAKVLGSMPEMKENTGLLLRISNAAASYLGIIDPKFPVQIGYYQ